MGSDTCRILLRLDSCETLEDDMNRFANSYVQTNKPREKARCKAPVLTVESWDGRPESFFTWYAITLDMLVAANMEELSEKIMVLKALPEDVKAGDSWRYQEVPLGDLWNYNLPHKGDKRVGREDQEAQDS